MLKKVISVESGKEVIVDTDKAAVYSYSNRQRRIVKSAEIYENGEPSGFYTTYIEEGTVDSVRDRLSTWDNALKLAYAHGEDFDSTNDPDGSKYDSFIRSIEEKQDKYFDEYGDFLPAYTVDVKGLVNAGFYSEEPLVPMGYLSLADYCKKHGLDMRNVRRKLAEGKMNGIKQANSWFLPEDEPYYTRVLHSSTMAKDVHRSIIKKNEQIVIAVLRQEFSEFIETDPGIFEYVASISIHNLVSSGITGLDESNADRAVRFLAKELRYITTDKERAMAAAQHIVNALLAEKED